MHISIDTSVPLSDTDKAALRSLLGDAHSDSDDRQAAAAKIAERAATAAKATAPKAEPKPEPKPKTKPKAEPKPDPEPEEDETGEEETEDAPTIQDAIAAVTKLMTLGKGPQVKTVLTELGVKRVREIEAEDLPAFLEALENLES